MDNQMVFEMLSELEAFFWNKGNETLNPTIDDIWNRIRDSLIMWHEYTGCVNSGLPLSRFFQNK